MLLYHGSYIEIAAPDLKHSRENVDFGRGFYTTPIFEQAVNWCKRLKRQGKQGVVSQYEFDMVELFFDGLIDKKEAIKRLQYEKPNLQVCFRTEKVLKNLQFKGSEMV